MLLIMNLEEFDEPGQLEKSLHFLVDTDQFHFATHLPDDAVTPSQFSQAIAVDEIHPGKIDQELLAPAAGIDVNQVTKLGPTLTQREPSHNIHHNDPIVFSCRYLKTHSRLPFVFSAAIFITRR